MGILLVFPAGGSAWRQQGLNTGCRAESRLPFYQTQMLFTAKPARCPSAWISAREAGTSRRGTLELGLEKQVLILAKSQTWYHVHSCEWLHFSVLPMSLCASCGDVPGVVSACSAPLAADAIPPPLAEVVNRAEQLPTELKNKLLFQMIFNLHTPLKQNSFHGKACASNRLSMGVTAGGCSWRREVHWTKPLSSGGAFTTKEEAFHLLGNDLIAWFQETHTQL